MEAPCSLVRVKKDWSFYGPPRVGCPCHLQILGISDFISQCQHRAQFVTSLSIFPPNWNPEEEGLARLPCNPTWNLQTAFRLIVWKQLLCHWRLAQQCQRGTAIGCNIESVMCHGLSETACRDRAPWRRLLQHCDCRRWCNCSPSARQENTSSDCTRLRVQKNNHCKYMYFLRNTLFIQINFANVPK